MFFFHLRGFQKSEKHKRLARNGVFRTHFLRQGGPWFFLWELNKRLIDSMLSCNASYHQQTLSAFVSVFGPLARVKLQGLGASLDEFGCVRAAFVLLFIFHSLRFLPSASERQENAFVKQ